MGTWGTGIYSNDTASNIKDACKEIFPFVSVEEGNNLIFEEFHDMLDMKLMDDDYASFWYALADWQWKHGMLNEQIKKTTLELLEKYTGIEDWEADASKSDVNKRKKVLDKLREQLLSSQPAPKTIKAKLEKPKLKPGDIMIFKTSYGLNIWNWHYEPYIYYKVQDGNILNIKDQVKYQMDIRGKYMAILCVGILQKPFSKYVAGYNDEYSIYTFYDYIGEGKPSIEDLSKVGFLPSYHYGDEWHYKFYTCDDFDNKKKYNDYAIFDKPINSISELDRFNKLIAVKKSCDKIYFNHALYSTASDYIAPKFCFEQIGVNIDTLLDINASNPIVPNRQEIDDYKSKLKKDRIE